jgi:hypothetical protein
VRAGSRVRERSRVQYVAQNKGSGNAVFAGFAPEPRIGSKA